VARGCVRRYPKKWVDAQLSHADPDKISATYNHAEYVEQRRVMMQDSADRLDLFEQNQVEVASMHLIITLQGLPTIAGQAAAQPPVLNPAAPRLTTVPGARCTLAHSLMASRVKPATMDSLR